MASGQLRLTAEVEEPSDAVREAGGLMLRHPWATALASESPAAELARMMYEESWPAAAEVSL